MELWYRLEDAEVLKMESIILSQHPELLRSIM